MKSPTFRDMKRNLAEHLRISHPNWQEKFVLEVAHKAAMTMVLHDIEREKELGIKQLGIKRK